MFPTLSAIELSLSGPLVTLLIVGVLVAVGVGVALVFYAVRRLRSFCTILDGLRQAIDSSLMGREANRNPWTTGLTNCLTACRDRGLQCAVLVDVGANCGDVSKAMLKVFPGVEAYLIEPQPHLHASLTELAEDRDMHFIPVAAGAVDGELSFRYSLIDHFRGGTGAIRPVRQAEAFLDQEAIVPVRSLDSLAAEGLIQQPHILKIDVEGMELDVLRGAVTILKDVKLVVVEATLFPSFIKHASFAELVAYMDSVGFVLYDISDLGYRPYDTALTIVELIFVPEASPLRRHEFWGDV